MKNLTYLLLIITSLSFAQKGSLGLNNSFIEEDKQLHLMGGMVVSPAGYMIAYEKTGDRRKAVMWGIASGTYVGLLKEITDTPGSGFNTNDLFATITGAVIGTFVTDLVNGILTKKRNKQFKNK